MTYLIKCHKFYKNLNSFTIDSTFKQSDCSHTHNIDLLRSFAPKIIRPVSACQYFELIIYTSSKHPPEKVAFNLRTIFPAKCFLYSGASPHCTVCLFLWNFLWYSYSIGDCVYVIVTLLCLYIDRFLSRCLDFIFIANYLGG